MQTAFLVRVNGKLKYIPFEDVLFIRAKDKYCEIVTVRNKRLLSLITLNYAEEKLPKNLFVRVHRSHIISLNKIESLSCNMVEIGEHQLSVSKEGYKAITERTLMLCPEMDRKMEKEIEEMISVQYLKKAKNKNGKFKSNDSLKSFI